MKKEIQELKKRQTVFHSRLTSIPSEKYELRAPIDVIIKIYDDEVIALVPELEIYGEGCNEFEALNDLKYELIDLLEDLDTYSDEHLGKTPQGWSKTLKALIEKCQ